MQHAGFVVSHVMEVSLHRIPPGDRTMELPAPFEIDPDLELKPERIQLWLAEHAGWRLSSSRTSLLRTRSFPSPAAAVHYGTFVSGLAAATGMPVTVKIHGSMVDLFLYSTRPDGRKLLTQNVLDLASQIG